MNKMLYIYLNIQLGAKSLKIIDVTNVDHVTSNKYN